MPFVDRQTLRLRALQRADMENSQFIATTEADYMIQKSRERLYNILVGKYEDYFVDPTGTASDLIQLTGGGSGLAVGQADYVLPPTYYKLLLITRNYPGGGSVELSKYRWSDIPRFAGQGNAAPQGYVLYGTNDYDPGGAFGAPVSGERIKFLPPPDSTSYELGFTYIPTCGVFTADTGTAGSMNHINGFDEWVVLDVAIKMLSKEEADVRGLVAERGQWMDSMEAALMPRDVGQPHNAIENMMHRGMEPDYYE